MNNFAKGTAMGKPRSTQGARSVIGVSLTDLARQHNLPHTTVKSRWYNGLRGEALVARRPAQWEHLELVRNLRAVRDRLSKPR